MKKLTALTIMLSYFILQPLQADGDKLADKRVYGPGISAGYSEQMVGEHKESTSYEILPLPILDAEAGLNINKFVSVMTRVSGGFSLVNQKNEVFIELLPMVNVKPTKETTIGVGVKLKHADGRYLIGNYTYNNAALYAEFRTNMSKRFNIDGYVGVSKNIGEEGYGIKFGVMKNFSKEQ
ncbi:MAG: hypothetical protein U0T83_04850 [Bacteriovoracaceae bacterium]